LESTTRRALSLSVLALLAFSCGSPLSPCERGACSDAGLVINELAGSGGDFVELFNASDTAVELGNHGLADADDAGIRYAMALRFPAGASVAPRGFFTVFLETDCPPTVTPCVRGEFGLSQTNGDTVTLLSATNETLHQEVLPPNAAAAGSSWARAFDGAGVFEVRSRTPGATNEK
jgi:hypothetical protein